MTPTEMKISKQWCLNMAALEGDSEIGAGLLPPAQIEPCPECATRYEAQVKLADLLAAEKTEHARLRDVLREIKSLANGGLSASVSAMLAIRHVLASSTLTLQGEPK